MEAKVENQWSMICPSRIRQGRMLLIFTLIAIVVTGCSFKFELTSQRTALENQIMGTYKELDEDLVLVSTVKAKDQEEEAAEDNTKSLTKSKVDKAKQNQEFNQDDLNELKDEQILGEMLNGGITLLPSGIGLVAQATEVQVKLAKLLVFEENRDRKTVWRRIIQESQDLSEQNLKDIIQEYVRLQQRKAKQGHWFQDDNGQWQQKR